MQVQTMVKAVIAWGLVVVNVAGANTETGSQKNSPSYLIDYLSLNGEPLRQEDGKKGGGTFVIKGTLNAFGSVTIGLNKRTETNTPKGPEEQPPYYRKNLYELSKDLRNIYLIRAEVRQKGSSYWQKVEVPNAFSRIIAPYDPEFDPYETPPEPAGKDIGLFYISDYVLNNTGYFEDGVTETVLPLNDFICMPSRKYEEFEAAIVEYREFASDIKAGKVNPTEKSLDTIRETIGEQPLPDFESVGLITGAGAKKEIEMNKTRDIREDLLKYTNGFKPMYDRLKGLAETWESDAVTDEEKWAEKKLAEALNKLEKVDKKADEFRTTLKWVEFARSSNDIINFNAADCYVMDDKNNSVPYSAKDGDELRIQIFRFGAPVSRADVKLYTQPALETEIHATFRDYGDFITFSPAVFYAAKPGSEFDSSNYNFFEKAPAVGLNIYWRYEGLSPWAQVIINHIVPGLSLAALGYTQKITGAENEPTTEDVDPEFSVGLNWFPVPSLRKYFTVYMMLYDFQWDNKLIGFSLAPGLKADKLFENNKSENIRIGR